MQATNPKYQKDDVVIAKGMNGKQGVITITKVEYWPDEKSWYYQAFDFWYREDEIVKKLAVETKDEQQQANEKQAFLDAAAIRIYAKTRQADVAYARAEELWEARQRRYFSNPEQ